MGHIHKYSMRCCKKQSAGFIYCCCCWAVIVRYVVGPLLFTDSILVSKTVFKNVCVAGMAVRLNMSPASLCSHIHKSTYNDCKPETHHPEKSDCCLPQTAPPAPHQQVALQSVHRWVSLCHRQQMYGCIVLLLLQNKQSICWWPAVKMLQWYKNDAGSKLCFFWALKKKIRHWNKLSHLSQKRPDVRKTIKWEETAGCLVIKY